MVAQSKAQQQASGMGSGSGQGSGIGKGSPYVEGSVFQALHQYEQGSMGKGTAPQSHAQGYVGTHATQSGDQYIWWNRQKQKGDSMRPPRPPPRQGLFLLSTQGGTATMFVPHGGDITEYIKRGCLVAGQGDENEDFGRWCESLQRKDGIDAKIIESNKEHL